MFWGAANCGNCHAIRGKGGSLGPDLTNVAGQRTVTQLRDGILQPDANPVPGYTAVTAVLKDGKTLSGVARNRTNYSLQLQDSSGNLHLLDMTQIRELTISKHSAMPGDYGKRFSKEQIQNLLAYLSAQSVRPVELTKK
ncbi:MAG: c-type cytochrome [Acidobacteriaceae bacterium]|nr:c-type cytochrome [Acidobacteriaceae bacterium]